ncbi:MAG: hypothetical protein CVU39_13165, partial [Chloroflexi bacterium HGW-Chloroflexi-10]
MGTYHTYYSYNSDDTLRQIVLPNFETLDYGYNNQGGLESVSTLKTNGSGHSRSNYVYNMTYDEAGRMARQVLGNSVTQNYTYYPWDNQGGRLNTIVSRKNSLTPVQNLSYSYDTLGNINSIMDSVAGESFAFGYDNLNRLTSVSGVYSKTVSYSSVTGNIQQKDGTYGYDTNHPHAVTSINGVAKYGYDANGSMTTRTVGRTTYSMSYDAENRLTNISGGSLSARYAYDGDGKRVLSVVGTTRTVYVNPYFEVTMN